MKQIFSIVHWWHIFQILTVEVFIAFIYIQSELIRSLGQAPFWDQRMPPGEGRLLRMNTASFQPHVLKCINQSLHFKLTFVPMWHTVNSGWSAHSNIFERSFLHVKCRCICLYQLIQDAETPNGRNVFSLSFDFITVACFPPEMVHPDVCVVSNTVFVPPLPQR